MQLNGQPHHASRVGTALFGTCLGAVTLLGGCGSPPSMSTVSPTRTATFAPTPSPTPAIPTVRYQITTQAGNTSLQATPGIALRASPSSQWTAGTDFQGLTCTAKGMASPPAGSGGTPAQARYQVFVCQLATGSTSGSGSFTLMSGSAILQVAQVEVMSSSAQGPGTPALGYTIAASRFSDFAGGAGVALGVSGGTNYQWTPGSDFQGLACPFWGNVVPGGPPGSPYYQVFTCQLAADSSTGQGTLVFAENGSTTATATARIKLVQS